MVAFDDSCVLISHRRQFIFIHVSKSAGTSIQQALGPYSDRPQDLVVNRILSRVGVHINYWSPYRQRVFREHATASTVRSHLPSGLYGRYFSFGFVRNPWDWLVSLYHYLLRTPSHRHHQRVTAMGNFREYLEFEIARGKRSQWECVCDRDGEVIVDFIGRFETLHEDFATVCRRLGIKAALPHVNRSGHREYRTYYRKDSLVELVAAQYQRDIELFGYSFDGVRGAERIPSFAMPALHAAAGDPASPACAVPAA